MLPRAASPTARHIPQHPDAVLLFDAEQPTCIDESAPGLALPMRHRVATIAAAADLLAGWSGYANVIPAMLALETGISLSRMVASGVLRRSTAQRCT